MEAFPFPLAATKEITPDAIPSIWPTIRTRWRFLGDAWNRSGLGLRRSLCRLRDCNVFNRHNDCRQRSWRWRCLTINAATIEGRWRIDRLVAYFTPYPRVCRTDSSAVSNKNWLRWCILLWNENVIIIYLLHSRKIWIGTSYTPANHTYLNIICSSWVSSLDDKRSTYWSSSHDEPSQGHLCQQRSKEVDRFYIH